MFEITQTLIYHNIGRWGASQKPKMCYRSCRQESLSVHWGERKKSRWADTTIFLMPTAFQYFKNNKKIRPRPSKLQRKGGRGGAGAILSSSCNIFTLWLFRESDSGNSPQSANTQEGSNCTPTVNLRLLNTQEWWMARQLRCLGCTVRMEKQQKQQVKPLWRLQELRVVMQWTLWAIKLMTRSSFFHFHQILCRHWLHNVISGYDECFKAFLSDNYWLSLYYFLLSLYF